MSTHRTRPKTITVSTVIEQDVDVEVTEGDLLDAGWHHESSCTSPGFQSPLDPEERQAALGEAFTNLRDHHDLEHGLTLWASCTREPCNLIPEALR
jgi:hypothetical protein